MRDDKISQLKKELDSMTTEMNDQMQQINKKMMLVMDEKDHQIKVLVQILVKSNNFRIL